jgi:hypothetical protein
MQPSLKTSLVLLCLLLVTFPALAQQKITGAHVTAAYANGKATFTVYNDSDREIKVWQIRTVAKYPNGHEQIGGKGEINSLPAGKSVVFEDANDYGPAVSVTAEVTLVVYGDNSAEATDEIALARIIAERKSRAYTTALLSSTLRTAAMDEQPTARLRSDLQSLMSSPDKRINKALISGAIDDIKNIADDGHEREAIQQRATFFQRMSKANDTGEIRRLQ